MRHWDIITMTKKITKFELDVCMPSLDSAKTYTHLLTLSHSLTVDSSLTTHSHSPTKDHSLSLIQAKTGNGKQAVCKINTSQHIC